METWRLLRKKVGPLLVVAMALICAPACGHAPRPGPGSGGADGETASRSPDGDTVVHVVRPGETLSRISARYGVPLGDLVRANGITDPDVIDVGQRILIPGLDVWSWPIAGGEVMSGFGARRAGRRHAGLDIRTRPGAPVIAARRGTVVHSGSMRGYGRTVILDHGDGFRSLYGHNSDLLVRSGQRVERGQAIALAGRTGNATAVHCHFEILRDGAALDPLALLSGER